MNQTAHGIAWIAVSLLLAGGGGCSAGKEYDAARKAELRGAAPEAYDGYRLAAVKHPGNGAAAAGLKRTGPAASAFWEAEAIVATDEERFDDAWRMWMRALEIRPDHPEAPRMIRQLEEQHPNAVVAARTDYLHGGSVTLAAVRPSGKIPMTSPPAETVALAEDTPAGQRSVSSTRSPMPDRGSGPEAVAAAVIPALPPADAAPEQPPASPRASEPTAVAMAAPSLVVQPDPASGAPRDYSSSDSVPTSEKAARTDETVHRDTPNGSIEEKKSIPPAIAGRAAPPSGSPKAQVGGSEDDAGRRTVKPSTPPPPARNPAPSSRRPEPPPPPRKVIVPSPPPREAAGVDEYAGVLTLSKKDRRYPKEKPLVDGIRITIRDTDDDLDADFDLHQGKKRIKKIRSLPVGRSCVFEGSSGAYYRLTVLEVLNKTHTARIGVKPA